MVRKITTKSSQDFHFFCENTSQIGTTPSMDTVSILVVDDDTTCLAIVAAILKKFNYQVVTVKHANDALCALRIKGDAFHLVVSDVHMPDMNGYQLQQAIAEEFNLPVVLMSADNKECVAAKGLESGAASFISKPISPEDLRNLWQFAAVKKKSSVVIEETAENCHSDESASELNEEGNDTKRKSHGKGGVDGKRGVKCKPSSNKKAKVIWNNSLHTRFLEAIRSIGLDRAVPKKILEVMNVPGLTRENVASHLQKYRIFLRRVSDASYKLHYADNRRGLISRNPRTNSAASSGTMNRFIKTGSFVAQSGFRQSQSLPNTGSLLKPNIRISADLLQHQNKFSSVRSLNLGHSPSILGTCNLINSSETSKDFTNNNVGHIFSNIKHFAESGSLKDFNSICSDVFKNSNLNAPSLAEDTSDLDHLLTRRPHLGTPYASEDHNGDGKQLSDVIADYQNLLLPSLQQPPLGEGDLSSIFVDQVSSHNKQNEGTSFNLHGGNHVASCEHVPNQQEDDDFLESLLGPFEECHNLGEI